MMYSLYLSYAFLLLCVLSLFIFKKFFNPVVVLLGPWTTALLTYSLGPIRYYGIHAETFSILFVFFLLFFLGCVTVIALNKAFKHNREFELSDHNEFDQISATYSLGAIRRLIVLLTVITSLISAYALSLLFKEYGGMVGYLARGGMIRARLISGEFELPLFVYASVSLILLNCVLGGLHFGYSKKLISFLPLLSVVLHSLVGLGRILIIYALLIYLISNILVGYCHHLGSKSSGLRYYIISMAIFVGIFVLIAEIRGGLSRIEEFRYSSLSYSLASHYFLRMIHYFVGGIGALDHYIVNKLNWYRADFGLNNLEPLTKYLFGKIDYHYYFVRTPIISNIFTFIRQIVDDFSMFGITVFPFLLGAITSKVFTDVVDRRNLNFLVPLIFLYLYLANSLIISINVYSTVILGFLLSWIVVNHLITGLNMKRVLL